MSLKNVACDCNYVKERLCILQRSHNFRLDVALIHVSPPDQHGFCSLGVSVDITRAAVQNAAYIIGIKAFV